FNLVDEFLAKPMIASGKLKAEQFFPFNGANPQAVASYNRDLTANGGRIDIALVSAGEDGHVAALFPRHPSFQNEESVFIDFHESPKPPEHRMSASRKLLLKSETILLLVTGDAKQAAWENYKNSSMKMEECPAKLVDQVPSGFVFTDRK
ncbi:MAG: 6-phosphogluconolactonase, partial [Spirochaetia bacterium]|nr:6-phosphogluconolactonase [Spirochaetia bacterium]